MQKATDYGSPLEDMDDRGGSIPWLPGDNSVDGMPKMIHRRAKRIIPDDEKDDKYWEKRKRNNMAAKRSRENKRQMEIDIRNKVNFLEEENALLLKEVHSMKIRFGIPIEQSVLTQEERAQCLQEVKNAQAAQAEGRALKMGSADEDVSSTSPGIYPVSMVSPQDDRDPTRGMDPRGMTDLRGIADLRGMADPRVMPDPRGGHSPAGGGQMNGQHKSPKVKEEPRLQDVNDSNVYMNNGPAVYGPFSPSLMWAPNTAQHHTDYTTMHYGHQPHPQQQQQHQQQQQQQQQQQHQHHQKQQQQHQQQQQQQPQHHQQPPPPQQQQHSHQNSFAGHQGNAQNKLPSINNAFHEKPPAMPSMYGGRYNMAPTSNCGVTTSAGPVSGNQYGAGDGRTPYDYYMAAAYSQGQAIYSPAHSSPNMVAAPADLSLAARGSKPHQQDDNATFLDKTSLPDEAHIPHSMASSLANSHHALAQQRQRGMDNLMAASIATLGQSAQDLMFEGTPNSADSLLDADPLSVKDGQNSDKDGSGDLLQDSNELRLHLRNLQARADHMHKLQTVKQ